jgi:hypothetical protein
MSVTTRNPMRMAGANVNSGNVSTGEFNCSFGGGQAATLYSGMAAPALTGAPGAVAGGADVLIFSGAGRLKDVMPHVQLSGIQITFYDSAVPTSGGPFAASGHKIIAVVPANTWAPPGGVFGVGPIQYGFDMPFQSGLCVASKSGQPGLTVSWFPETNVISNP